jgi:hypothetical protein
MKLFQLKLFFLLDAFSEFNVYEFIENKIQMNYLFYSVHLYEFNVYKFIYLFDWMNFLLETGLNTH